MDHESYVRRMAKDLVPGQSRRVICPFCNAQHEKSFDILRRADKPWRISFKCYRGTCSDNAGFLDETHRTGMVLTRDASEAAPAPTLTEREVAPHWLLREFEGKYSVPIDELCRQGVRYSAAGHALCMPWLDDEGRQIGWVEKRTDKAFPKSHHELGVPKETAGRLGFPRIGRSYQYLPDHTVGVLVESLLDAYRLNIEAAVEGYDICAVALLGADLSNSDAHTIAALFKRVMVCLDPDQWPKGAMRVLRRFRALPVTVGATSMPTDPKDATTEDFLELFARCKEL